MKTIIEYIDRIIKRRQRKYLDKAFYSEKGDAFTVNKPEYKSKLAVSRRNNWGETMIMVDDHFIFISQEETSELIKYLLDK